MYVSRIKATNWRNFRKLDVEIKGTTYLLGANGSGKSNFLDILRFMRDIVNPKGGGLQYAVDERKGMTKLRCLASRQVPGIELEIELKENGEDVPKWRYCLSFADEGRGKRRAMIRKEAVYKNGVKLFSDRPNKQDEADNARLAETYLEQTNANKEFREISEFFQRTLYLHLIPQLLKHSEMFVSKQTESDPFGQGFLNQLADTPEKTRASRLGRIEKILKKALPQFEELKFETDRHGNPHLAMRHMHWRPNAGWQQEDQFSDGTLRLIALLWTLMTSDNLILLEEPELSLHEKLVEQIPKILHQAKRSTQKAGGQIFVSTHSKALLSDPSIAGTFLVLTPSDSGESTQIQQPTKKEIKAIELGMSPADILLPKTSPIQGELF
jgi:predicted ATPase